MGALLLLFQTGVAAAQGGSTGAGSAHSSAQSIEQAREHMESGESLFHDHRFVDAAHEFEAAYAAMPSGAFLYNAGVAYERAAKPSKAADFFARYLASTPNASDATSVLERIQALRTQAVGAPSTSAGAAAGATAGTTGAGGTSTASASGTTGATGTTGTSAAGGTGTAPASRTTGGTGTTHPGGGAAAGTSSGSGTTGTTSAGTGASPGSSATATASTGAAGTSTSPSATGGVATPTAGAGTATGPDHMKSLLAVRTTPEGAHVTVQQNGHDVSSGVSPFVATLDEGAYHLVIEHSSYHTVRDDLHVARGKVFIIIVAMSQGQFLGYLHLVTQPPGARVFLDDRSQGAVGTTPFLHPVPTGTHTVWLEHPGYTTVRRRIQVGLGAQRELRVHLARPSWGRIRLIANMRRGTRVFIDDHPAGRVPYDGRVPAGPHSVRVEGDGMKPFVHRVDVSGGQVTPVEVRLRPAPSRGPAWVTAVIGTLLVGGGIACGVESQHMHDQLAQERDAGLLASDDSRLLEGKLFAAGADIGFGLGALLGALSIFYFLRDPLPASSGQVLRSRNLAFDATVGPGRAAAAIEGSF